MIGLWISLLFLCNFVCNLVCVCVCGVALVYVLKSIHCRIIIINDLTSLSSVRDGIFCLILVAKNL